MQLLATESKFHLIQNMLSSDLIFGESWSLFSLTTKITQTTLMGYNTLFVSLDRSFSFRPQKFKGHCSSDAEAPVTRAFFADAGLLAAASWGSSLALQTVFWKVFF